LGLSLGHESFYSQKFVGPGY